MDRATSSNDHEVVPVVEMPFAAFGLYHRPKDHIMDLRSHIKGIATLIGPAVLTTMLPRAVGAAEVDLVELQDELAKTLVHENRKPGNALPSRCRWAPMPFWQSSHMLCRTGVALDIPRSNPICVDEKPFDEFPDKYGLVGFVGG